MDNGKNISTPYNLVYYIFSIIYPHIINIDRLAVQAWICKEIKYFSSKTEKKIDHAWNKFKGNLSKRNALLNRWTSFILHCMYYVATKTSTKIEEIEAL